MPPLARERRIPGLAGDARLVASCFFSRAEVLRRVQWRGRSCGVAYGILIAVVAADALVFASAAWTMMRRTTRKNPHDSRNLPI